VHAEQTGCVAAGIISDDTINIHLDRGPITATAHEAGRNPKIESVRCVFIEIVRESETYHIYKAVLLTIKVAARNVSRAHRNQAPNESANNAITSIIQQNWM
jgi:hypothetical protein